MQGLNFKSTSYSTRKRMKLFVFVAIFILVAQAKQPVAVQKRKPIRETAPIDGSKQENNPDTKHNQKEVKEEYAEFDGDEWRWEGDSSDDYTWDGENDWWYDEEI